MQENESLLEGYLHLGNVYREHGIRGEVKVRLFNPESLEVSKGTSLLLLRSNGDRRLAKVKSIRRSKEFLLILFEGVTTPEEAQCLRHAELYLSRQDVTLNENEIFLEDLKGCSLEDSSGAHFGVIEGFVEGRPHILLEVLTQSGVKTLVPYIEDWIVTLDLTRNRVVMNLPEGL